MVGPLVLLATVVLPGCEKAGVRPPATSVDPPGPGDVTMEPPGPAVAAVEPPELGVAALKPPGPVLTAKDALIGATPGVRPPGPEELADQELGRWNSIDKGTLILSGDEGTLPPEPSGLAEGCLGLPRGTAARRLRQSWLEFE